MITTDLSADTRVLADLLIAEPVGSTITLPRLSAALGRPITSCRHTLYSAIRVAEREAGAIYACERGIGYRRLSVEEIAAQVGSTARHRIRGTARRARRALLAGTARQNDMSPDLARRVTAEANTLALINHIAQDKHVRADEQAPTKPEPVAVTARRMMATILGQTNGEAA